MNRRQSWNVITVFLLLIFGFTAASILHPSRDYSERENRSLAQKPESSIRDVFDGTFEEEYEDYLTDQFVLRDGWLALKTGIERATLKQDVNGVFFAEDDYLIEGHAGTFETDLAASNVTRLSDYMAKAAETYGADHVTAMVVPNAVDILRDKLPAFASPYDEEDYLNQLSASMPEQVWFDSAAVLRDHTDEQLYYRTDHHWTTLGAFYVFQAWANEKGIGDYSKEDFDITAVTDSFEGTIASKVGTKVKADTIERWDLKGQTDLSLNYNQGEKKKDSIYDASSLDGRDKYAYFFGGNYGLVQIKTGANTGRRLLMLKDSYAHCFAPFLTQAFDQIDLLDLRYFNQSLEEFANQNQYTDVLVLYNASGFAEDISFGKLMS